MGAGAALCPLEVEPLGVLGFEMLNDFGGVNGDPGACFNVTIVHCILVF
jgi:hypothetical protein